jgi:hypothetical protein
MLRCLITFGYNIEVALPVIYHQNIHLPVFPFIICYVKVRIDLRRCDAILPLFVSRFDCNPLHALIPTLLLPVFYCLLPLKCPDIEFPRSPQKYKAQIKTAVRCTAKSIRN